MKMLAPAGFTAMSHGGATIAADADGFVDVSEDVAKVLESHGFSRPDVHIATAGMARTDLLKNIMDRTRRHFESLSDADLRRELDAMQAKDRPMDGHDDPAFGVGAEEDALPPPPPDAGFNPATVTDEDIEALNRPELFAYLKARGVATALPVTNAALREIAHRTARGA